ncbi:MAG: hypothetical protein J0H74_34235 [Chitinophagaceae bacterium]|nr:hypothetical protein [Chitinophagaceae bacterium]
MSFNPNYNWLRWVGVLPGAVLGSGLIYLLIYYPQCFVFGEHSLYGTYIVPYQSSIASGIAFTYCGTAIAPSLKKPTSIALVVLALLLVGIGMVENLKEQEYADFAKEMAAAVGVLLGYGSPDN